MSLFFYLLACSTLTLSPGPDVFFVLSKGMERGRRTALATAWGMCSGCFFHTFAVAAGISALCMQSPQAFLALKLVGAGYLLYLAYKTVTAPHTGMQQTTAPHAFWAAYRNGLLMNLMNPKVALFFIAFLPQNIDKDSTTPIPVQLMILGLLFTAQAFFWFTGLGYFAGTIGRGIQSNPQLMRGLPWISASILFLIGISVLILH
jgi:threonine/homoserine/homoserine lactone efflux protein